MATATTLRQEPTPNGSRARRPQNPQRADAASARSRNRTRVLLGVLIALGSAFFAAVLYANAGQRSAVLVLARPVAAGQTIQQADLREATVAVDGGVQVVAASRRSEIVGRTATVPLIAGSLLTAGQVGDGTLLDPSNAVFGAVLPDGSYPSGLRAGDKVLLYELPAASSDYKGSSPAAVAATVVSVRDGVAPATISATFAVDPGDAGQVAMAAGQNRLIVVLAPR